MGGVGKRGALGGVVVGVGAGVTIESVATSGAATRLSSGLRTAPPPRRSTWL